MPIWIYTALDDPAANNGTLADGINNRVRAPAVTTMLPARIASSNGSGGGNRLINTVVFGADTSQQVFCRSTDGCGSTIGNGHDGSARRVYKASYSQPLVLGWGRAGVDVQATTCDSALCDAHHVPVID